MVPGIGPAFFKQRQLIPETCLLLRRVFRTTGKGFMVIEQGLRGPQVPVAAGAQLEAEINIIITNGKTPFIQAANFQVAFLTDGQTGCGQSRIATQQQGQIAVPKGIARKLHVRMGSPPGYA